MNQNNEQQVLETISKILKTININKIYYIDDIYSFEDSVETIIGWMIQAKQQDLIGVVEGLLPQNVNLDDPDEVWIQRLRGNWDGLQKGEKYNLRSNLALNLGNESIDDDVRAVTLLEEFLPDDIDFYGIEPKEWEEIKNTIFEDEEENGTMCIFDRDLHLSSRYTENSGIDLLINAIQSKEEHSLDQMVLGMLTKTINEGEEITEIENFKANHDISPDEYLLLSKDRLADNPIHFAEGLKKLFLNHIRFGLVKDVSRFSDIANEDANRSLKNVNIYDFDIIVLKSSEEEGIWEAETLFRLFEIFRKHSFRRNALSDHNKDLLIRSLSKLREIRSIPTIEDDGNIPPNQRYEIRRLELYEDYELLNKAFIPLELGDIFSIGDVHYILINQPCDLVIRADGKRAGRVTHCFNLVNIMLTEKDAKELNPGSHFELPYYDPESNNNAFVKFRVTLHISQRILDLSVFNPEGQCRIDIKSDPPPHLHSTLKKRYKWIIKKFNNYHVRINEINSAHEGVDFSQETRDYLTQAQTKEMTFSNFDIPFELNDNVFQFGITRIGRLRGSSAHRLLNQYYAFLSRDAEDHDFAQVS